MLQKNNRVGPLVLLTTSAAIGRNSYSQPGSAPHTPPTGGRLAAAAKAAARTTPQAGRTDTEAQAVLNDAPTGHARRCECLCHHFRTVLSPRGSEPLVCARVGGPICGLRRPGDPPPVGCQPGGHKVASCFQNRANGRNGHV